MGPVTGILAVLQAPEGGSGGGVSMFTPQLGLIAWTWIVFVILLWALSKLAWPAILKMTEEREQGIANQLSEAARLNAESKTLAEQQKKLLDDARTQSAQMIAESRAIIDKERANALEQTRTEQEELLARARRDIQVERDQAIVGLRREAIELSLAAAAKLVGQRMDSETDKQIVTSYLATLETGK